MSDRRAQVGPLGPAAGAKPTYGTVRSMRFHRARSRLAAVLVTALVFAAHGAAAHETLTIVSWGGAYTRSQMLAYVNPYREQADIQVRVEDYNGGLDEVRAQVSALNVTWDVIDLGLSNALRGCAQGLLEEIDPAILPPAPDGTPAREDFLNETLTDCAVGQNVFSTVIAYDPRAFGNDRPRSVADFFNVERFPGRRGLRNNPQVALEWALMADGVPPGRVYEVLSTPGGLERAFRKLDQIRPFVVWWENAADPPRMLRDGTVTMTSTYNGRIQDSIDQGAPLAILWDGQVRDFELWAIVRGTRHLEHALKFITFASEPQRQAEQARHIAYGPARRSAMAMLDGSVRSRLPTAPENSDSVLDADYRWWAENQDRINALFDDWLAGAGPAPPTFWR